MLFLSSTYTFKFIEPVLNTLHTKENWDNNDNSFIIDSLFQFSLIFNRIKKIYIIGI